MKKIFQKIVILLAIFITINSITGIALADQDVIIGFNKPVGPSEKALIHSHSGLIKKSFSLIPAIAARIPESNISKIKEDPRVKYIEEDKIFEVADEYSGSWGSQFIGSDISTANGVIGTGVKIAVLDTGIDCGHEDLKNNCNNGYDFYFNDSDASDDSWNSHGTHVSGIIAAEKNGIGIVGVAPGASLYAVKVTSAAGTYTSIIISGIEWAVKNNMDIVSMSLQGSHSQAFQDAVDAAYAKGLLLVAAAGNTKGGAVAYPAGYESVIAVTAIDENEQRASFSPIDPKIELAAPGVNINSTIVNGYGVLSGTSMAAPYVTGVAALILSTDFQDVNGDGVRNNIDVRIILQETARDVGDPGRDSIYGYGIVDASNVTLGIPNKISIIRTNGSPIDDQKFINLSQGSYQIAIHSDNLTGMQMSAFENGTLRNDLISVFNFHDIKDFNIELNVNNNLEVIFTPFGIRGSLGYVKLKAIQGVE